MQEVSITTEGIQKNLKNFKIFSDFIKSKAVLNCLYYERK